MDKGWNQQQLADACGLSKRTIQRIENTGNASLDSTAALCAVFGVQRQSLLWASPVVAEVAVTRSPPPWWIPAGIGLVVGVVLTLLLS